MSKWEKRITGFCLFGLLTCILASIIGLQGNNRTRFERMEKKLDTIADLVYENLEYNHFRHKKCVDLSSGSQNPGEFMKRHFEINNERIAEYFFVKYWDNLCFAVFDTKKDWHFVAVPCDQISGDSFFAPRCK